MFNEINLVDVLVGVVATLTIGGALFLIFQRKTKAPRNPVKGGGGSPDDMYPPKGPIEAE